MPTTTPLVSLHQVTVRYGDHEALSNVDMELYPGQIVTLVGPNGAGKSTLARVVLGSIKPHSGSIKRKKKLRIGYMPQSIKLDDSLPITVDRFLWLGKSCSKAKRMAILNRVGVAHLASRAVQQLSGGEWQRVLLARALLRSPDLLVLDEPAQGVDITGQDALYGLLKEVRDEIQCAILLISHDLHLVMAATDKVLCLHQHVCCAGTPDVVEQDPAFRALFPQHQPGNLALYQHHHDHEHHLDGIIE
ncbi:MAG TPA: zinc ABC transporter ATP-binding protein ZnuC [Alcanivoracaceae bacterium]|nr:zinc ABC transporter ATP-binding protein ZnuC [Alcanivoracaceae bacterium]